MLESCIHAILIFGVTDIKQMNCKNKHYAKIIMPCVKHADDKYLPKVGLMKAGCLNMAAPNRALMLWGEEEPVGG